MSVADDVISVLLTAKAAAAWALRTASGRIRGPFIEGGTASPSFLTEQQRIAAVRAGWASPDAFDVRVVRFGFGPPCRGGFEATLRVCNDRAHVDIETSWWDTADRLTTAGAAAERLLGQLTT